MSAPAYAWVQDEPKRLCAKLTQRERDTLIFMSKGLTMREAAAVMCISHAAANERAKSIYSKLDVNTIQEAAVIAAKAGLV